MSVEWAPPGVDPERPSVARVHDALLGGMENFAADRSVARKLRTAVPEVVDLVWCNRAFIGRVVDFLVREAGIRQIIDLGAGLPTVENTHEVAQFADPTSRVVYVDLDPMVEPHARAILNGNPCADAVTADARDVAGVLGHPAVRRLIDLSQPTAVLAVGLLHLFSDQENPHALVRAYVDALPPGSYLAVSNFLASESPKAKALEVMLQATMGTGHFRDRPAIERFFDGLRLVEPGVVHFPEWHPDERVPGPLAPWEELLLGGVARKP
ncbi:O-methyltransferase involved in polyketide biosynthesis [Nonomuraea thailandensis]|uniref:O-methyltransferase involved in polyketide biosynthesis n=1 Tax=Nonomuraea thailandensis TaxID=1188745 RepID=A0A9X2GW53_9ACTN|nr:SAM-dependent methyltransferase [Nonomuraea thailandensis]MCP2365100.1 O-methyltransferase involved in polyketide biosynthesis [Nonomuraea thailandensis]